MLVLVIESMRRFVARHHGAFALTFFILGPLLLLILAWLSALSALTWYHAGGN